MVKKILSVVLCFTLLFALFVPASAAGQGSGERRYASLPFRYIAYGYNWRTTQEFALQESRVNSSFVVESDYGAQDCRCFSAYMYAEIYIEPNEALRFVGTDILWDIRQDTPLKFGAHVPDVDARVQIDVEYSLNSFELNADASKWIPTVTDLYSFTVTDTGIVDIGEVLTAHVLQYDKGPVVNFARIAVTVTCLSEYEEPNNSFYCEMYALSRRRAVNEWLAQFDLRTSVTVTPPPDYSGVSLVDWLLDAVGAFLEFELFPGLSFDGLIKMIIVFAIVFWFITLLI